MSKPERPISDETIQKLLAQNEELIRENAEYVRRLERLERRGGAPAAEVDTGPTWGEGPDPLADVNWSDPAQVDAVASASWSLTLRRGSSMNRDGKIIKGPRLRFPIADLETAFAHKHKFQEIAEIERQAKKVAEARQRFSAAAEAKGQPLGFHWGPKWLAPEPSARRAAPGPVAVMG